MKQFSKSLVLLIALGFVLRLSLFLTIFITQGEGAFLVSDSQRFISVAQNLIGGHGFSQSSEAPFLPSAHFPPIYPIFVAASLALSSSLLPLVILQLLLSSAIPLLAWLLAKRFTARTDVPLIAAGLMALEPVVGILGLLVLTDTIAVFALLLASLFFLRIFQENFQIRSALLAGIFLAISTLTKPNAQLIFLGWFLILAWAGMKKHVDRKTIAAFLLAFFLILSPWLVRNAVQFGSPSISATGLRNIYTDFAVSVLSYETERSYGEIEDELRRSFAQARDIPYSEIQENPALGKELAKEALQIILSYPQSTASVLVITLQAFFTQDLYAYFAQRFHLIPPMNFDFSPSVVLLKEGPSVLVARVWELLGASVIIPLLGRIIWVLLTTLSIFGLYKAYRHGGKERMVSVFMLSIILYYAATSLPAAFSDQGRHRYPADAFIMTLAGYGISQIMQRFKRGALA